MVHWLAKEPGSRRYNFRRFVHNSSCIMQLDHLAVYQKHIRHFFFALPYFDWTCWLAASFG